MAEDLKSKTAKGVGWGFVENILGSGITALANIVLARILSPSDFGIISMTTIFITLSTSLVDSGFTGALTRKKEVSGADLNTVFYFNLTVSCLLYLILFFCSPFIAAFFSQDILVPIIRILSLSLIINALGIVQKVLFVRRIDFKTQAGISLAASVTAGGLSIAAAVMGYGVWSLVILQLTKLVVNTILLWVFSSWHPGFGFSRASFRDMFSFGGRLLITSIVSTLWNELYSIIIGRIYSPSILGQYSRADKIKGMVTSNVSMVMQKVSYPVLSSIQDEGQRQIHVYSKVLKTTVLISFTAVLGLWAVAGPFVVTVFGEQWLPAVDYLRILCLSGLFLPLMICSANVINADGRSDITLILEIVKTVMALIPVVFGIVFSVEALLWSMVGVYAVLFIIHAVCVSKVIHYSVMSQIKDILPVLAVSAVMAFIVNLLNFLDLRPWVLLLLQLFCGGLIIVFTYELVYKNAEYRDIRNEIVKLFRKYLCPEKSR
ncbi:MAG TPA: lipopolysaccharide biosynthesis protein [Candidatus Coprenecus stercoravium]|uniref:Lipopolysaccharide biosynthesis protein n=1 Tax=Candidatus Coprenecus stercoravium TaxID=2840735 RepID=A0A9D2GQB4_9BACT|nr:lipopolysaccharide biosynthesis protein [Candidatus Coprenecus stercoravium]